jgi:hypothetical protein
MEDGQNTKNIIRNYHEEWAIIKPNEGRFKPKSWEARHIEGRRTKKLDPTRGPGESHRIQGGAWSLCLARNMIRLS